MKKFAYHNDNGRHICVWRDGNDHYLCVEEGSHQPISIETFQRHVEKTKKYDETMFPWEFNPKDYEIA